MIAPSSTVGIADLVAKYKRDGMDVIDFSAGRAAEATPKAICDRAVEAMLAGDTHQTPARGKLEFLEAAAEKLARENGLSLDPKTNLIATLGCKQGLTLALMAVLAPDDEVIIEDPCFVSYAPTIHLCGGIPVRVPLDAGSGRWQREALAAAVTPRTKAILMCSPHNPTGIVPTYGHLQMIAEFARGHDLVVISDEIYERTTWGDRKHICLASLPGMLERTITLMGLTKSHSMGGWRIGFAFSDAALISAMVRLQQHLMTCAGSFTQVGAAFALREEQTSAMQPLWQDWENRCRHMAGVVNALPGLECRVPQGAFYLWVDIRRIGMRSEEFAERLLEESLVAVVPGDSFGPSGEGFIRITCVRSWDDIQEGVRRIESFLPKNLATI